MAFFPRSEYANQIPFAESCPIEFLPTRGFNIGQLPVVSIGEFGDIERAGSLADFWIDVPRILLEVKRTPYCTPWGCHLEIHFYQNALPVAVLFSVDPDRVQGLLELNTESIKFPDDGKKYAVMFSALLLTGPICFKFHDRHFKDNRHKIYGANTQVWVGGGLLDRF